MNAFWMPRRKIGERWTYQARESDIPQAVTIINGKVTQIEDLTR